ncbi:MAG: ABC transporter permease [Parcubacteria group bacterium CG08_land_8_20_14_0_20_48_21]|nr:MAG: hypothetical protein AUK21_01185 [Parcubacteria group bacterium CG2_30_48_51]PIS32596.1 MAG: ABC transporter permease [Parcubacteria group bacterium CG08_land_8_20_14_0_20_48_21]PIW79376.1 MAG: ABC transporter permease [Parcubacteria group bacterium CG_4_8_14_3_um_filter_48_16]PIY77706.1 MAG: ABC transporter permease [Parcubacteria group bacterium CG_4_10_14_0_8_um_filter_48_154]PIZ77534.1 MAG: ABC transporter permease [bacterium CG_4_10_14_0_2_um_filter_48_144]PJC39739.1 MAG: ABC tran
MQNFNLIGFYTFTRQEIHRFFRVGIQTLITPWISALLYILIFGEIVGRRIGMIHGVAYIDFVLPGLLMMNLMQASFSQTSSSLYFQRFLRHIEEVLTAPLSYLEIIGGYVIAGVVRGLMVGIGVYVLAFLFTITNINHIGLFVFYAISVSIIFSLLGLLVGLWANSFEHLAIPPTFVIMPLSFLGGLFNSLAMLPENMRKVVRLNPLFYFIDGMRYAMIGIQESDRRIGFLLIIGLVGVLTWLVWALFKRGYKVKI